MFQVNKHFLFYLKKKSIMKNKKGKYSFFCKRTHWVNRSVQIICKFDPRRIGLLDSDYKNQILKFYTNLEKINHKDKRTI